MDKIAFIESNTTGTGEWFLNAGKKMGLAPLFLTKNPKKYPFLKKHLIHPILIDTDDPEALTTFLKKVSDLKGVFSSSDSYIYPAALVSKKLNLPHTNPEAIAHCRDKYRLIQTLKKLSLPAIPTVRGGEEVSFSFPVIAKPNPGTGSIGVELFSSPESLPHLDNSHIIQEYIEGEEYSAEIVVQKGEPYLLGMTKKHLGPKPHFVESGHDFPAPISQKISQEALSIITQLIKAIDFDFGPLHVEFRVKKGTIYIIEVNPRLAGGMIPQLIEEAQGIPLIQNILHLYLGQNPSFLPHKSSHAAIRFIIPTQEGTLANVPKTLHGLTLYKEKGALIQLEGSFKDRIGHSIVKGDTLEECHLLLDQALGNLTVTIAPITPSCGRGRLAEPLDPRVKRILEEEMIPRIDPLHALSKINRAHVAMLKKTRIITPDQAKRLIEGVEALEKGDFATVRAIDGPGVGFYLAYEEKLIEQTGIKTGGLIHIGRSRNDINATLQRLQTKEIYQALSQSLWRLRSTLLCQGECYKNLPMPIYSQYQPAMPATYGYYLTGVEEALALQSKSLLSLSSLLEASPLGAGAGGGTTYPIDPEKSAEELPFKKGPAHALTAVASRDLELTLLALGATLGTTISRVAQDYHLWLTKEFEFFSLPDRLCGISSTMPQKKNPYLLEKIKGKAIQMTGAFTTAAATMHKVPFGNSVEVGTEALTGYYSSFSSLIQSLELLSLIIEGAEPLPKNMIRSITKGLTAAAPLAEGLSQASSLTFREAHEAVGKAILKAEAKGEDPLEALLSLHETFPKDPNHWHDLLEYGKGPGPHSLQQILETAHSRLRNSHPFIPC
ncbi:lyase family protein [Candidatus Neptunochlamydia vexilliferae]|uniref:argininosuccinate lyase n=1 Tax=Candidatus Neptunichlamydia vexilliferae TaxID=1651774 RepID=A0ABS0B1U7_9BACT|nr:lyase family protein [Candidatus Neptunochlamydia vexilliferae]MBF5059530.1 Argininosuccinate lyase 2 [Candidatus Neptunochlamydia vexilliferae]